MSWSGDGRRVAVEMCGARAWKKSTPTSLHRRWTSPVGKVWRRPARAGKEDKAFERECLRSGRSAVEGGGDGRRTPFWMY